MVWGTTYLANLYSLNGFPPFMLSVFRYLLAGFMLLLWCWRKKSRMPSYADMKVLSISGIFMLVGGSGLVVYAEQYVNSGYTAVLMATEPLWFVLLDRRYWRQYLTQRNVVLGILIGFAGIVMFALYSPEATTTAIGADQLKGTIIVLISSVLWVLGTLYGRSRMSEGGYTVMGTVVQLFAAGIFSLLISGLTAEFKEFAFSAVPLDAWLGLAYLVFFGSIAAYLAFNWLVTVQAPVLVSTHTYVNPIVAIIFGWLLAGELISKMQVLALVFVLGGIILAQVSGRKLN